MTKHNKFLGCFCIEGYNAAANPAKKGFSLLELIIVIIIIGVLATLGITLYTRAAETSRRAEPRIIAGLVGKRLFAYYMENNGISGVGNDYLGIGTSLDQIPQACRSSHYFYYIVDWVDTSNNRIGLNVNRCTSGGKPPQASQYQIYYTIYANGSRVVEQFL